MNFLDAKWEVTTKIYFKLKHHNFPFALEISLWLNSPKYLWIYFIGVLTKIGTLSFPEGVVAEK